MSRHMAPNGKHTMEHGMEHRAQLVLMFYVKRILLFGPDSGTTVPRLQGTSLGTEVRLDAVECCR